MTDDADGWPRLTFTDIEASMREHELGFGQHETLSLKPWQLPTHDFFYDDWLIDEVLAAGPDTNALARREFKRAVLARRLLDHNLSLFEPDPPRALNDDAYRNKISERVRKLAAANQDGLSDDVIEHAMKLAPYPLFRETYEQIEEARCRTEFLELLSPVRDFDAVAKAMSVVWKGHRERTAVYDRNGKLIKR